jgi:hypothetical protein
MLSLFLVSWCNSAITQVIAVTFTHQLPRDPSVPNLWRPPQFQRLRGLLANQDRTLLRSQGPCDRAKPKCSVAVDYPRPWLLNFALLNEFHGHVAQLGKNPTQL